MPRLLPRQILAQRSHKPIPDQLIALGKSSSGWITDKAGATFRKIGLETGSVYAIMQIRVTLPLATVKKEDNQPAIYWRVEGKNYVAV